MPELPEVETIRSSLEERIGQSKILKLYFYQPKILKNSSLEELEKLLVDKKIKTYKRIGKTLLVEIGEYTLTISLRMEGKFYINEKLEKGKHTVFIMELEKDNGDIIFLKYEDVRKFSTLYITKTNELYELKSIKKIGLEPFDNKLTVEYLKTSWKKKSKAIKAVILEQDIIAGIGNIYADEILFACKIHPETSANCLSDEDLDKFIKYTREILQKAIKLKGSTIRSYTSLDGSGTFQKHLKAYGRGGSECLECNEVLLKIRVGGRGTSYCPSCQTKQDSK